MTVEAKICGLSTPETLDAAVQAGARWVGFVTFPKSPRHLGSLDLLKALGARVPASVGRVGLFVDPDDALLRAVLDKVPLDMIQLHGAETPARVAEVEALTGLPVIKAVGLAEPADLDALWDYGLVADMLLIDAKPPKGAALPGGNGVAFDWRLLAGRQILKPWLLAGGLTPENVTQALRLTRAPGVDVSSGVESAPGIKDPDRIRDFIARATAPIL